MKKDSTMLTIKEIKSLRKGQVAIVFRQHHRNYELSKQEAERFRPGMRVQLKRGKLSPC